MTHGAGLAVIFPAFLQYAASHNPDQNLLNTRLHNLKGTILPGGYMPLDAEATMEIYKLAL